MILEELLRERERLEFLLSSAMQDTTGKPEGSLRISKGRSAHDKDLTNVRFYQRKSQSDRVGTYIPKDKLQIAQALAQKTYAEKLTKTITPKLEMVNELITEYTDNLPESVYAAQSEVRQRLIQPYILPDEEYVAKWLDIPYEPNPKYSETRDQITANGELVRSKSEVIIADNLKMLGIPYKYEAPFKLKDGETIYPDFTCLNVRRRKVIYLEHFGRMDLQEYRTKEFFWKLRHYDAEGIIQGKDLIMTFEDGDNSFNFASYKNTIEDVLLG